MKVIKVTITYKISLLRRIIKKVEEQDMAAISFCVFADVYCDGHLFLFFLRRYI